MKKSGFYMRKTFFRPGVRAVLYGLLVFAFLVLTDQLSVHYGLKESERVLDDFSGAVIAGLLIYRNEYRRTKYLQERLKTIELMNHHVRNALQVIVDSVYIQGLGEQLEEIRDSVKRIDWALKEILPGRVLDQYHPPAKGESEKANGRSAA
jgi:hypothetical protein